MARHLCKPCGFNWTTNLCIVIVSGYRSVRDRVPDLFSPLILTDDTCQPLLIRMHMETRQR